ncbi:MAG: glycosyltransferase family 2 protein [Fuscovulum sp.]|jgi:putative glycosyltransferase|nr:MAG: glycosyltransferase family 2 protein [Fuscovulum sp.]
MTIQPSHPALSIVATMYRSEAFIEEFCDRISRSAAAITPDFEIILVNDGSPDASLDRAKAVANQNPAVVVVDLSRNFGHHAAILAGLENAEGNWIYLTDIDLEEQPEWLADFWNIAQTEGHDVVFGIQKQRIGSAMGNFAGSAFWWVLNASSTVTIPANQMTCRIFSKRYRDALLSVGDKVIYLGALFPWVGFSQKALELVKTPRRAGTSSTYNLTRKLRQTIDSLTSFTASPLVSFFFLGLAIWIGSMLYGAWLVSVRLIWPNEILSGFTAIMFSIWFLGGLLLLGIGVVGLYVSKLFQEVKARPRFIIRSVVRGKKNEI